ncbi:MAG: biopolymer transporter ExbD [Kiritimatiellae bacterium]|nr:biopolymer transporter ExbD [Kiritimatiellia bacterium]
MPKSEETGFQMAPLIDMVFLLLIFFMCASQLNQLDRPKIEVPVADNAKVPEDLAGRVTITVQVNEENEEKPLIYLGNQPQNDLKKLGKYVQDVRANRPDLRVHLRADKRLKHRQVRDVMEACADVGINDIIIATYQSAE